MARKWMAAILLFVVLGSWSAYKLWGRQQTGLAATGTIEVTQVDLTPKVSGYLSGLTFKTGDWLEAGALAVRISRPDLAAQKLRDEAALKKAELQLRDLENGARLPERQEAAAQVRSAEAAFEQAAADYRRLERLLAQGAVAVQQWDAARTQYRVAAETLTAAQARRDLVEAGQRPDVITAQRQEVERSAAVVKLADEAVRDTEVRVPRSGRVLTKNFEDGEFVNAGAAIATLADEQDCWVKIYVSSTQLGLLTLGQRAEVRVDSFPQDVFAGTVREISQQAEFTPRQSLTKDERAKLVFAVKINVDNSSGRLKPGMPADVVLP